MPAKLLLPTKADTVEIGISPKRLIVFFVFAHAAMVVYFNDSHSLRFCETIGRSV